MLNFFKNLILILIIATFALPLVAQDFPASRKDKKETKKEERRDRINAMIRQEEEGILIYSKQSIFGLFMRTNGYGFMYEKGKMKSLLNTTTYGLEISEIKHPKEDKFPNAVMAFGNPYIYGKINNFYQAKLGLGQQRILGQKGNKNGIAVTTNYSGGLSLGLLRPYYIEVEDQFGKVKLINYEQDSTLFLNGFIRGGGGLEKGWNEIKVKPGAYAKGSLRFDFGRFNEVVSAIEVGLSIEAYTSEIPIMAKNKEQQIFFQGHLALLFGRRK